MSKHKVTRYDGENGSMVDQTEEEAANEAALNADLPRRQRLDAEAAEKAKPRVYPASSAMNAKGEIYRDDPVSNSMLYALSRSLNSKTPAAKPASFKEAFAASRKSGEKTFEYNGKKYTTELASSTGPGEKMSVLPVGSKTPYMDGVEPSRMSGPGRKPSGPSSTPAKKMPARPISPTPSMAPEAKDRYGRTESERAANRASAGDTIKKGLSSVGDYFRNLKTPAERRSEEAKKATSAMKRGGPVKKMASGGSVSSRADGIAQRGKTRGKMC